MASGRPGIPSGQHVETSGLSQQPGMPTLLGSIRERGESYKLVVEVAQTAQEEELFEKEKSRREAQSELLGLLRQQLGIYEALGLRAGKSTTDRDLLSAFSLVDSPAEVLRTAGCNAQDRRSIINLVPAAFQPLAQRPKSRKEERAEEQRRKGTWFLVVLLVIAVLSLIAGLVMGYAALSSTEEEAEWSNGTCELKRFSAGHGNCNAEYCGFDVAVWKDGRSPPIDKPAFVRNWFLPLSQEEGKATGEVKGAPFRCCNLYLGDGFYCCSWYDRGSDLYCDQWSYRRDRDGQICPEGRWRCKFQTVAGELPSDITGLANITRLEVAEFKSIWPLVGAGIATGATGMVLLVCLAFSCGRRGALQAGVMFRYIVLKVGALAWTLMLLPFQLSESSDIERIPAREFEGRHHMLDLSRHSREKPQHSGRKARTSLHTSIKAGQPPQLPQLAFEPEAREGSSNLKSLKNYGMQSARSLPCSNSSKSLSGNQSHHRAFTSPSLLSESARITSKDLKVVDLEEQPSPKSGLTPRSLRLAACAAAQSSDLLRPIINPLPPRRYSSPGRKQRRGQAPEAAVPSAHSKQGWPAQGKAPRRAVELH